MIYGNNDVLLISQYHFWTVSVGSLAFHGGALSQRANPFSHAPPWPEASVEFPGPGNDNISPGPDQTQPPQPLHSRNNSKNPSTLIKKAGPYILGKSLGAVCTTKMYL